jgi:3-oxo-5alpha-steroid 4-dehydrogenase
MGDWVKGREDTENLLPCTPSMTQDHQPLVGNERGVRTDGGTVSWDEATDVVVVGFGAGGGSAAIEARSRGADVIVADRFQGGGATKLSAGVYYAGGGTRLQRAAGYEDTPEDMFAYLKLEARDVISDAALRSFCERSVDNFEWLSAMGVPFPPSGEALKTSYPPDDCTLYFSGNEIAAPYCKLARPVPRGHRPLGKGLTGHLIFGGLHRTAMKHRAQIKRSTRAERLVVDDAGRVIGVVLVELSRRAQAAHHAAMMAVTYGGTFSAGATEVLREAMLSIERRATRRRFVRAKGGVVLSAGGFVFNPELMRQWAPNYADSSMRLGTAGDDGEGIHIGRGAGGAVDHLGRCCAWRFINPPSAWTRGILVGPDGTRICNEELYGSTLGEHLAERFGGKGLLLIDKDTMDLARRQLREETMGGFQLVFGALNNYVNYERADTLEELARKCELPLETLRATVARYNAGVDSGDDEMQKHTLAKLERAPFFAINCDLATIKFPTPCITLGGLVVDGVTQRVVREGGGVIEGLYAAGRNAVGVSSYSYVSGLSIADGIFSGRNAGAHAADRAIARDRSTHTSITA